jgi:2-dehydro-3-deoxyphosphogluconate aldolase/(4S)-4-hydroxy-2-oxoglutarate aldolase
VADAAIVQGNRVPVAIRAHRLIAVLRRIEPRTRLLGLVEELVEDGFRLFEVTFDAATAAADLGAVRNALAGLAPAAHCHVGAGTVRSIEQLEAAAEAGAAFAVSPVLDPPIVARAQELGIPFIPGAYTPTEVDAAWRAGAAFVKLFPASSLGPSHVRELRGPLPEVELIVTGGIDASNAIEYLEAGAVAVGIGSALTRLSRDERRQLVEAAARTSRE